MNGTTGTWGGLVVDYTPLAVKLVTIIVMFMCLGGAAMGIRYIWRTHLRSELSQLWYGSIWLYHIAIRNPVSKWLQPLRRLHSKWSAQNLRETMAKWRKGHLANAFYETIHREIEAGRLSKQQGKQLQSQMAKFFGLDDLARLKTHQDAIRQRLMLNKLHEIGPAKEIPGGKPGEDIVPEYGQLGSKFLGRKKTA